MKTLSVFLLALLIGGCASKQQSHDPDGSIKAYNLDFNWGEGGPNGFAKPGLWADASPSPEELAARRRNRRENERARPAQGKDRRLRGALS